MVCASIEKAEKIAGGFVPVDVAALMTAWRACQVRPLKTADFRAWLACHELLARRCHVHRDRDRSPRYRVPELAQILGVSERRARASVKLLVGAGLIDWSAEAVGFPDRILRDEAMVNEGLDAIGGGRGSLAIPRRMLRHLANGATAARIATVLGLLLRCLSRRKAGWDGRGRCKASWIASTFAVSIPAVKAARRELVGLGWITAEPGDQWAENRWGRAYRIDLGWGEPASAGVSPRGKGGPIPPFTGRDPIPPRPDSGPISIPPDLHQEPSLSGGLKKPGTPPEPTGFFEGQGQGNQATDARPLTAPRLADVRVDDLKDTARLLDLHRQAIARGLVTASEADRLRFVGAAEHSLAIAVNPSALFAWLVLRGCWRFVTSEAEDRAVARLKAHRRAEGAALTLRGVGIQCLPLASSAAGPARVFTTGISPESRPIGSVGLSEDAQIVKAMREATIRAGIYRDPWPAFQARYPEWDRARWDRGLVELGLA